MTFLPATRPAPEMPMMLIRSAATRFTPREARVPSAKMRRAGAAGLLLALGLVAAVPAVAQTVQPPGDLMRPQGQAKGAAPVAVAQPADGRAPKATVERITSYFNSVQSMTGTFTQIDPDGSKRTGDFYMQKPGRVRFEYDAPSPVELISNGQSVAVRDRNLNTQDITPLSQTPLRFLLAERIDLGTEPHVTGIFQDDRFVTVVMQETVPMFGTYRLLILFDAKTSALKQWVVTDPQGYDTQVSLSNVQVNKRPDPKLFVINFERMLQ